MDHNLEDSLTLEGMDFDHSEDVVNQADIQLEDRSRLDSITVDMIDGGGQSHNLMEAVDDEVIVSDLIEDPFPFQEYSIQSNTSTHNLMINPHQMNQLSVHDPGDNLQYTQTLLPVVKQEPAKPNVAKVPYLKTAKRVLASPPLRQVAIAPKPVQTKPVQYSIAPKPVALVTNKHAMETLNKIPLGSGSNVKGNTVLAQLGRQLVMVPKKIKLMSSTSSEGILNTSQSGLQYQVACSSKQAQQMTNKKNKPMLKIIQIQDQSGADKSTHSSMFTKVAPSASQARYVMQQKTVPITIGGNSVLQNFKIAGKKKMIAIKSLIPNEQQGNIPTKKVVISSNSNQKVLIKTNAPTSTTQAIKDSGGIGQRTEIHPINVPGKGIQYIKLVTNKPTQKSLKQVVVPSKNFVFTDSKGNIIQMTAEKVVSKQPTSIVVPGTVTGTNKGVVKTMKTQKKLVRIAPVSKVVSQSISQPARSSQSLLAPISTMIESAIAPMTSLPSISPVPSPAAETAVSLEEFNEMVEQSDTSIATEQSFSLSNFIDNSRYTDANDFSTNENDFSTAEDYATAEDTSHLHHDEVENVDSNGAIDIKPTLESLISDAVSEERGSNNEMDSMHEVEVEFEKKQDLIRNASFILEDDIQMEHDKSHSSRINKDDSLIIVPGSNYTAVNESLYSDDSQSYRNRRRSTEDRNCVPLLSVEAECIPYNEYAIPESPEHLIDPESTANLDMRPRKACNCTKSQCLKLYCDCFANGEFCNNCNCNNCFNNLENEEVRQKAIRSCLDRNPNAFRPKIGKSKTGVDGPEIIRRHRKGCNCKRSGCLKNYCECYEAKIACTVMCKCVGCRNVEETLVRRRDAVRLREKLTDPKLRPSPIVGPVKQACSFMTMEVIEAVCQCLVAAAGEGARRQPPDAVADVIDEFARCLQDVIAASHHAL